MNGLTERLKIKRLKTWKSKKHEDLVVEIITNSFGLWSSKECEFTEEEYRASLRKPNDIYLITLLNKDVVGTFELKEYELTSFGIIKKHQRKGYGTELLKYLLLKLPKLWVEEASPQSIKLYKRLNIPIVNE